MFLEADAPRVLCRVHGVTVAAVPWARHQAGHTHHAAVIDVAPSHPIQSDAGVTCAVHERTPVDRLREMIYAYPTFHRAVEDGLGQLL